MTIRITTTFAGVEKDWNIEDAMFESQELFEQAFGPLGDYLDEADEATDDERDDKGDPNGLFDDQVIAAIGLVRESGGPERLSLLRPTCKKNATLEVYIRYFQEPPKEGEKGVWRIVVRHIKTGEETSATCATLATKWSTTSVWMTEGGRELDRLCQ